MVKLDEAHAALRQRRASRQFEANDPSPGCPVAVQHALRLLLISQAGHAGLHPEGHLILRTRVRISESFSARIALIQRVDGIDRALLD